MTFISWLLELIAGLSGFSVTFTLFLQRSVNPIIFKSVMLLDMPLNFILIPMSYILNNDINKVIVMSEG